MTVDDVGVSIVIDMGGYVAPAGSTATLLAAPGWMTTGPGVRLEPLVISTDGLTATYVTTGTDFTVRGEWTLQVQVKTSAGDVYTSKPMPFYIGPLIA